MCETFCKPIAWIGWIFSEAELSRSVLVEVQEISSMSETFIKWFRNLSKVSEISKTSQSSDPSYSESLFWFSVLFFFLFFTRDEFCHRTVIAPPSPQLPHPKVKTSLIALCNQQNAVLPLGMLLQCVPLYKTQDQNLIASLASFRCWQLLLYWVVVSGSNWIIVRSGNWIIVSSSN